MKDQKWLSERVWDIMHFKKFSLRRLFPLAEMNSAMELQRHLDGTTYITPTVLTNIATGLGITIDRLERADYANEHQNLVDHLKTGKVSPKIIEIAKHLVHIAVGITEKVDAYRDLGWTHYHSENYKEAGVAWESAYKLSLTKDTRKKGKYLDEERLFRSIMDLTVFYFETKDYEIALETIAQCQPIFLGDFIKLGQIHQQRGLLLAKLGNKELGLSHYIIAQQCFRSAGDKSKLGRVMLNLADLEYHSGDFAVAKDLLKEAKEYLTDNDTTLMQAIVDKDLARVLIMTGDHDEALNLIDNRLEEIRRSGCPRNDVTAKLLLFKLDITREPEIGNEIFSLTDVSKEVKCNAADLLLGIYLQNEDYSSAKKYHVIMKENITSGVSDYKTGEWV